MAVYYVLLLLILGLGLVLRKLKPSKIITAGYILVIFGYMWFLTSFREGIGYDYDSYIRIFQSMQNTTLGEIFSRSGNNALEHLKNFNVVAMLKPSGYETGFTLLTWVMGKFINSTVVMYGVYNLFIFVPIAIFVYKFCIDPWLSSWLYVVLYFLYNNMNFIRQGIACAIGIFAYEAFKNRKTVKLILIVILASLFHITALVLIPIYFICLIKPSPVWGAIYAGAVGLLLVFIDDIIDLITDYTFKSYKGSIYVTHHLAFSYIIMPLLIAATVACLYPIWKKRDPSASMFLSLAVVNATLWFIAVSKVMIVERFSMFSYVFTIVFLPEALRSLLADPKDVAQRAEIAEKLGRQKHPREHEVAQLTQLDNKIKDKKYYYWSAVVALIILSTFANHFAMEERAHRAVPYYSVVEWLNPEETLEEFDARQAAEAAAAKAAAEANNGSTNAAISGKLETVSLQNRLII